MNVGLDQQHRSTASAEIRVHWLVVAGQLAEEGGGEEILVDLSQVERITSQELSELIRLQLLVRKGGRKLVLENADENLRSIFELTRLTRLIEMR
ncbi:STAS domain-containing protein [Novipirellula caenicola]|uniref:STAS domain-containing protein n=1 Tax=Novipirellula caenicola TaxID=1536901 RepID=A0ABP9W0H0_9BACT